LGPLLLLGWSWWLFQAYINGQISPGNGAS
jgi:hypothetical protein